MHPLTQAAMKIMADSFPGAFTGYTMTVAESHQSSKVGRCWSPVGSVGTVCTRPTLLFAAAGPLAL